MQNLFCIDIAYFTAIMQNTNTLYRNYMSIQKEMKNENSHDDFFSGIVASQINYEGRLLRNFKKQSGTYLTNTLDVIDRIIDTIRIDDGIFSKRILEPSCGHGIFLLRLVAGLYKKYPEKRAVSDFIANNIIFNDINPVMQELTKSNLNKLYYHLFREEYSGGFNSCCHDFTRKMKNGHGQTGSADSISLLQHHYGGIDYIIGNPPYVTLYGRRDKKLNEQQRIYYLENYTQFPDHVKNGKINYVMLFIEHSLDFLKESGELSFIIDISFFETAYKYTRKYVLENSGIISIDYNIKEFGVASGQIILKLRKGPVPDNEVKIYNAEDKQTSLIRQNQWNNPRDEYRFRLNLCSTADSIINRINSGSPVSLFELHPEKNLRTCAMLLDMESEFVSTEIFDKGDMNIYPYYRGSKSLKEKFSVLTCDRYLRHDKSLQHRINSDLKARLESAGIKNKKRIGLGETAVYDNPKVFIRQSAKEIISSYDENKSSANNSLYVFTLRDDSAESKKFLKFLCGYLNSEIVTFYAQKRNIIRFTKGKQPQIKVSDLYSIRVPEERALQNKISDLVDSIYNDRTGTDSYTEEINNLLYGFYQISDDEIRFIRKSIKAF